MTDFEPRGVEDNHLPEVTPEVNSDSIAQKNRPENGEQSILMEQVRQDLESIDLFDVVEAFDTINRLNDELQPVFSQRMNDIFGVDPVSDIVQENIFKQAESLLLAIHQAIDTGNERPVFQAFGETHKLEIQEVVNALLITQDILLDVEQFIEDDEFSDDIVLEMVDVFLFDGHNAELAVDVPVKVYVESQTKYSEELMESLGLDPDDEVSKDEQPDVVLIDFDSANPGESSRIQNLVYELTEDVTTESDETPVIIVHSDVSGKFASHLTASGLPILFSEGDKLLNTFRLAQDIIKTKRDKPESMDAKKIAKAQEKLYDNSDLREWESHTADTKQALTKMFKTLNWMREKGSFTFNQESGRDPQTILELGVGEGRITNMLAALGKHVIGIDISQAQLDKIPDRLRREVKGLQGEVQQDPHSYPDVLELADEGLIDSDIFDQLDPEEILTRIAAVKGDFHILTEDLRGLVFDWVQDNPDRAEEFFQRIGEYYTENPLAHPETYFHNFGVDMVIMPWHTFCEYGSVDNQLAGLQQMYDVMEPGAAIHIEIPDRTVDPYKSSLEAYHALRPDEPYGTIRDASSDESGVSTTVDADEGTPRFFPDRNQLKTMLEAVGFVDVEVEAYYITSEDDSGETNLQVRELVVRGKKGE